MKITQRLVFVVLALVSLGAVGLALISQHVYDMQPCPWCILQRVIFILIAALLLLAAFVPGRAAWVGLAVLAALSGVAAALYQHFVAAKSDSCALTLADKIVGRLGLDKAWPDVFEVRASCADAAVDLLHVPYEFWSLALYVILAMAALAALRLRTT
jgi:disulfide bond formation protein DsbB